MHKLQTATGPSRASYFELRNCTASVSTLGPFATAGESAPMGIMPWSHLLGYPAQATTFLECERIQVHIVGAPPNLKMVSSPFGGL